MTIKFALYDQEYLALNGRPQFKSPAISLIVNCESQQELDKIWDALRQGGSVLGCGWLTDKYGISWQIVPALLSHLLRESEENKRNHVTGAYLQDAKARYRSLAECLVL